MQEYAYIRLTTMGEIQVVDHWEESFNLQELQKEVDGGIEIVNTRFHTNLTLVVDDEGLIKNKPLNPYATLLYGGVMGGHHIAGNAVLCIRKEYPEPDVYPMSKDEAESVFEILKTSNWKRLEVEWR